MFKPCSACCDNDDNNNKQMFKQDKPVSTKFNSTVIKGVLQKLKSKKAVKSTRKLQNVGGIPPVITSVHLLMFILFIFAKQFSKHREN